MCQHLKWILHIDRDTTRSHPACEVCKEERDGITKRSRNIKKNDFFCPFQDRNVKIVVVQ